MVTVLLKPAIINSACSVKWSLCSVAVLHEQMLVACSAVQCAVCSTVQASDDLSRQLPGRFSQLETIYLIHWVGSILQYYLSIILQFSPIHPNHHHSSVKFIQLCSSIVAAGHFLHCSSTEFGLTEKIDQSGQVDRSVYTVQFHRTQFMFVSLQFLV